MPSLGDGQDIAAVALYIGIKRSTLMKVDSQHLRILGRYAPKQVQITIISNCTSKSACNTQCTYIWTAFLKMQGREVWMNIAFYSETDSAPTTTDETKTDTEKASTTTTTTTTAPQVSCKVLSQEQKYCCPSI